MSVPLTGEVFCNQCGHRNPEGANFCSSCGAGIAPNDDLTITLHTDSEHADPDIVVHLDHDVPAVLVLRRGADAGETFVLSAESSVAGRNTDSDIFLDDVTVSRRHAVFVRTADRYTVRDDGSLNGTYVNRQRISEGELHNGDEVQIGKFRLVFLSTGERRHTDSRPTP
jgi:hypothetical protein